jgi:hypothetical protein
VSEGFTNNVFINHPFDARYLGMRNALVFTIHDCGFVARSASEVQDSSQNRLEKIYGLIEQSKFGIHDISRTELDRGLPRFNMPFELGLFLGCKRYGGPTHRQKSCLVLDRTPYRYQRFLSDLSGADIEAHNNTQSTAITHVRNWLQSQSRRGTIPSARSIRARYGAFRRTLPGMLRAADTEASDLDFLGLAWLVTEWLRVNAR